MYYMKDVAVPFSIKLHICSFQLYRNSFITRKSRINKSPLTETQSISKTLLQIQTAILVSVSNNKSWVLLLLYPHGLHLISNTCLPVIASMLLRRVFFGFQFRHITNGHAWPRANFHVNVQNTCSCVYSTANSCQAKKDWRKRLLITESSFVRFYPLLCGRADLQSRASSLCWETFTSYFFLFVAL